MARRQFQVIENQTTNEQKWAYRLVPDQDGYVAVNEHTGKEHRLSHVVEQACLEIQAMNFSL